MPARNDWNFAAGILTLCALGIMLNPHMDEATRRDWGRRIKERRKGLGLSQDQLGAAAGTNQATISKLERGLMPVISDDLKWKVSGGLRAPVGDVFPYPAVLPPLSKPEALVS